MKKIYRKISLLENRMLSLLMAVVMFLTSINLVGLISVSSASGYSDPLTALADELFDDGSTVRSDALHFYVRHWHTQEDTDAKLQGNQAGQEEDTKNYFVIAEGYIVPNEETGAAPFEFYFVGQDSENNKKELIPITEINRYDESYVGEYDKTTGSITLKTKVLVNENKSALENFSGFSISAGRDAVKYTNDGEIPSITITYSSYVRLVKGHIFYVRASQVVRGSNDAELLGFADDIDTAEVYTYKEAGEEPVPHSAGDIVKLGDKACETLEEVGNAGAQESDVELTKFYSTTAGLHTDSALLVQDAAGRVYQFDLAAWYTQGVASQVGLILDASGGFGFAYDYPDPINVFDVLGREQAVALLGDKIDGIKNETNRDHTYLYPQRESMIGYYEIKKGGSSGTARTWYFNSIAPTPTGGKRPYNNPANISSPESYGDNYFGKAFYPQVNNGLFDFGDSAKSKVIKTSYSDFNSLTGKTSTGWGDAPAQFAETNGGLNIAGGPSMDSAFILSDASTPSGSFTVSFIMLPSTPVKDWPGETTEILYIGSEKGTVENADFRLVRDKNNDLVLYHDGESEVLKSDIATERQTLTFTYDGNNTVMFYYNGELVKKISMSLDPECVVFDPFADGDPNKDTSFYVDEMIVYDVDLDVNEVERLYAASGKNDINQIKNVDTAGGFTWDSVFLTESQLALLLDTHKTDNSLNGFSGYSYFVYNAVPGTEELAPLAYWDGAQTDNQGYNNSTRAIGADGKVRAGTSDNLNGTGWYYMSSASWDFAVKAGTAKRMAGINNGGTFYDRTDGKGDYNTSFYSGTPAQYNDYNWTKGVDTVEEYKSTGNSPTKFYIDSEGNLRCFFNANATNNVCSYVYELADDKYVKTEAMQRVLGNFATMLIDRSPATEVSAVRFSGVNGNADTDENRKKLVLLDWSSDASDIAGLMSMRYGNGGFNDYETSSRGVKQYNYTLTGGSYIYSALKSFRENLLRPNDNKDAAKFLIVITDGADTETIGDSAKPSENTLSVSEAKKLKDAGYTIMSVMFGGTTFNKNHPDYKVTYEHMSNIASKNEKDEPYIFTTDDLESLMDDFSGSILDTIAKAIEGYTVKNYIDPRFNVVGSDGTEYILGAYGNVEIAVPDGTSERVTVTLTKETDQTVSLAGTTNSLALTPYLRYDSDADMYYLEWNNQTIPTSAEGAPLLGIWSAQITLKAKDDFIGGNAVLTNGNGAFMNYLYHKDDPKPSSGTDKMIVDEENGDYPYPSKGFPRTTVNVQLMELAASELYGNMYMGELVSSAQLLTDIEDNYVTETYYLEYLKRFAYQRYLAFRAAGIEDEFDEVNLPLLDLLNQWLGLDSTSDYVKQFSVRYMYLPRVDYDSETGKIKFERDENGNESAIVTNNAGNLNADGMFDMDSVDVLGILTYRWERKGADGKPVDFGSKDYVKDDNEAFTYSLTVEFTPLREGDSLEGLNSLADDDVEVNMYGSKIFAGRIIFRSPHVFKETWEGFDFAREDNLNGKKNDSEGKSNAYIKDADYKWDPAYRPAKGTLQLDSSTNYGQLDENGEIKEGSNVELINKDRTLSAHSDYHQTVVSGGVALELKIHYDELTEALGNEEALQATFTLDASRAFTDTSFAEEIKDADGLDDFAETFTFTFELDYTKAEIGQLEAEKDEYGFVRIFATVTAIDGGFGAQEAKTRALDLEEGEKAPSALLPIGTYKFEVASLECSNKNLHFGSISYEDDEERFTSAYGYFQEKVLDGIEQDDIFDYGTVAIASADKKAATFYIGTSEVKEDNNRRGDMGTGFDDFNRYTNTRFGIIVLSAGTTRLTIKETGGATTESFLYRITGTALDGEEVNIIVSVKGQGSTTVELPAGTYRVTEISDWSWKYETGTSTGDYDANGTDITLRYRGEGLEHKYVTYSHERNDNKWLGGEGSQNNPFSEVTSEEAGSN